MAFLLSFLPSWFAAALAGLAIVAGAGVIIYSLVPLVPYGRIATILGAILIGVGCWFAGEAASQAVSEAAALRQRLADAKALLLIQQKQADALHLDSVTAAAQAADIATFKGQADAVVKSTPDGVGLDAPTADRVRSLWPSH